MSMTTGLDPGDWGHPRTKVEPVCRAARPPAQPHGQLCQTSTERGAVAFWMVAEDTDNAHLIYGISGPNAYFFNVTRDTGEVRLAYPLDFEVTGQQHGKGPRGGGRGEGRGRPLSGGVQVAGTGLCTHAELTRGPFSLPTTDAPGLQRHHLCERRSQHSELEGGGGGE
ncbi:Hypothetical predicted protein [Marmota monax]|uniref:Cadherin domain-containing protein n=1 Tax=Marmota monax TaxID=9995 RepID=A0A5E4BP17_MARMO|nr:Hypothetical predicted protein [Marmota monax]